MSQKSIFDNIFMEPYQVERFHCESWEGHHSLRIFFKKCRFRHGGKLYFFQILAHYELEPLAKNACKIACEGKILLLGEKWPPFGRGVLCSYSSQSYLTSQSRERRRGKKD